VTATETACQIPSRLAKTRREALVDAAVFQLQLEASPAYAGVSEDAHVLLAEGDRFNPWPEGLIISNAFVMGSPKAAKPVKSSARMCASGARSPRRYASFHSLSRRNISAFIACLRTLTSHQDRTLIA